MHIKGRSIKSTLFYGFLSRAIVSHHREQKNWKQLLKFKIVGDCHQQRPILIILEMKSVEQKTFPVKLPKNFHGQRRLERSLAGIYAEKLETSPDIPKNHYHLPKFSSNCLPRLDKDIIKEREEMLIHPQKISSDMPEWSLGGTYKYYRRENFPKNRSATINVAEQRTFDVLNRKKVDYSHYDFSYQSEKGSRQSSRSSVYDPIDPTKQFHRVSLLTRNPQVQVTPKIGAVESRNFAVTKPLLKIGKTDYIDTYSPF